MNVWLYTDEHLQPRPLVFIEDRANHIEDFCRALAAEESPPGELMRLCTIVILDAPGPDTEYRIVRLLLTYPKLQIVAGPFAKPFIDRLRQWERGINIDDKKDISSLIREAHPLKPFVLSGRYLDILPEAVHNETEFVQLLDKLIRPEGLIVCDIELKPLQFGGDKGVYAGLKAASTAGQMQKPPAKLVVVSNREIFTVAMPRTLGELGIIVSNDEDNIFEKTKEMRRVISRVSTALRNRFPWRVRFRHPSDDAILEHPVGSGDQSILDAEMDLVIWPPKNGAIALSGRAVEGTKHLQQDNAPARMIALLIETHFTRVNLAVGVDVVGAVIDEAEQKYEPPQVRAQIGRMLRHADVERILPKAHKTHGYRFGDNVTIGSVLE